MEAEQPAVPSTVDAEAGTKRIHDPPSSAEPFDSSPKRQRLELGVHESYQEGHNRSEAASSRQPNGVLLDESTNALQLNDCHFSLPQVTSVPPNNETDAAAVVPPSRLLCPPASAGDVCPKEATTDFEVCRTVANGLDAACEGLKLGLEAERGVLPSSDRAHTDKSTVVEPSGSNSQSEPELARQPVCISAGERCQANGSGGASPVRVGENNGNPSCVEAAAAAAAMGGPTPANDAAMPEVEEEEAEGEDEPGRRRSSRSSQGRQYMSLKELREERARQRKAAAEERKRLKLEMQEEKKRLRLEAQAEKRRLKKEAEEEKKRKRLEEREEKKRQREQAAAEKRRQKEEERSRARRVNGSRPTAAAAAAAAIVAALPADAEDEDEEAWKKNAGLTSADRARIPFGPMSANDRVCAWLWGKHFLPFAEPPTLSDDLLATASSQKGPPSLQMDRHPAALSNGP